MFVRPEVIFPSQLLRQNEPVQQVYQRADTEITLLFLLNSPPAATILKNVPFSQGIKEPYPFGNS